MRTCAGAKNRQSVAAPRVPRAASGAASSGAGARHPGCRCPAPRVPPRQPGCRARQPASRGGTSVPAHHSPSPPPHTGRRFLFTVVLIQRSEYVLILQSIEEERDFVTVVFLTTVVLLRERRHHARALRAAPQRACDVPFQTRALPASSSPVTTTVTNGGVVVGRAAPHLAREQGVRLELAWAGCHDLLAATATDTALSVTIVLAQDVQLHEQPDELLEYRLWCSGCEGRGVRGLQDTRARWNLGDVHTRGMVCHAPQLYVLASLLCASRNKREVLWASPKKRQRCGARVSMPYNRPYQYIPKARHSQRRNHRGRRQGDATQPVRYKQ